MMMAMLEQGVAEIVDEDAAEVEIGVTFNHQGKRDAAIDAESGERCPDHPAFDDGDGGAQSFDSFVTQPER